MAEVEELVADGPCVAMAMIRAANSVGSPLPWANAVAAWPGGSGHNGATTLRWAVEDLSRAGLVVATTRGLMATALGAPTPPQPEGPLAGEQDRAVVRGERSE